MSTLAARKAITETRHTFLAFFITLVHKPSPHKGGRSHRVRKDSVMLQRAGVAHPERMPIQPQHRLFPCDSRLPISQSCSLSVQLVFSPLLHSCSSNPVQPAAWPQQDSIQCCPGITHMSNCGFVPSLDRRQVWANV